MLDCAAVHPPAPLCHGASPPAAAPATLPVPMMAQLWRLDPAPRGAGGGCGAAASSCSCSVHPARPEPQADFIKVPGRLRLERGVVRPVIPGFALLKYSHRGPAGLRPSSFSEKVLGRGPFCPSHFHSQVFCDLTGVLTVVCRILSVAEFSTSLVLV